LFFLALISGCESNHSKVINEYYESGKLKEQYAVISDTLKNGEYRSFFENGNVRYQANYTLGKQNGLVRLWYEQGNLSDSFYVKDDRMDGSFVAYYETGELLYRGTFIDDSKMYGHTRLSTDGKVVQHEYYYPGDTLMYRASLNEEGKILRDVVNFFVLASDFSGVDTFKVGDTVKVKAVMTASPFDDSELFLSVSNVNVEGERWEHNFKSGDSPKTFALSFSKSGKYLYHYSLYGIW